MRRPRARRPAAPQLALVPAWTIVLVVYVGTAIWSFVVSTTSSRILPRYDFVGLARYGQLFSDERWLVSLRNLALFGVSFIAGALAFGFLLAVALDQKVKAENLFRTIFLLPHALSLIVSGLIWNWLMNPVLGLQAAVRAWGWSAFTLDWTTRQDMAVYALVIAALWHSTGLVMILMLAGLRGVDEDIWRAARMDGIPQWRIYLSIVLPSMRPMVTTAVVLLSMGVIKIYDLVAALTGGGPGYATEVPAKFVMDYLFARQDVSLAMAGSTVMLVMVAAVVVPWVYAGYRRPARRRAA